MKNSARLVLCRGMAGGLCSRRPRPKWPGTVVNKISIRYVGPPPVSDEFIRANIRVKVGEPSPADGGGRRRQKPLLCHRLFLQNPTSAKNHGRRVDVTYIVQGKPILTDIKIVGNKKMSTKKIKKKITSKQGQPLDERKLFDDAQAIKEMYEKAGYQKTTVTCRAAGHR
jgi:outer membrane protein assembly factor BamA